MKQSSFMHNSENISWNYLYIFLIATPLFVAVLFAAALILIRSESIFQNSRARSHPLLEHRFSHHGEHADVVMIGDSTGLFGIKPDLISSSKGISVVNLNLYSATGYDGYRVLLDKYLSNNSAPKAVVFYISAESLYRMNQPMSYDSCITWLRYMSVQDALSRLNKDNIRCVYIATKVLFKHLHVFDRNMFIKTIDTLDKNQGWMEFSAYGFSSLEKDAQFDGRKLAPAGAIFDLKAFVDFKIYISTKGIPTFVYLAPMPKGNIAAPELGDLLRPYVDELPKLLPNEIFDRGSHPTDSGALLTTQMFSDFLVQKGLCRDFPGAQAALVSE